jgi:hypothetical protein
MDIQYKNYETFKIIDQEVNLISDSESDYPNVIAEIDNEFFYLGDKKVSMETAIEVWQIKHQLKLKPEEVVELISDESGKISQ